MTPTGAFLEEVARDHRAIFVEKEVYAVDLVSKARRERSGQDRADRYRSDPVNAAFPR